ncbi:dTMP kinase [Actinomadura flavalba]|uniref:dTMP kinase n=1 Tax=Actinomadura flavalba TaxID=1120938 RepID=UPI0003815C3D|nr:dTMP kinase [Actinomadura flavalba]
MTRTDGPHPAAAPPGVSLRRFQAALSLSSLGHWLSVPALVASAAVLTRDDGLATGAQAIALVLVLSLLPALVLTPVLSGLAARADRRTVLIAADLARLVLIVTVPLVGALPWTAAVAFLAGCLALLWTPALTSTAPLLATSVTPKDAPGGGTARTHAAGQAPGYHATLPIDGRATSRDDASGGRSRQVGTPGGGTTPGGAAGRVGHGPQGGPAFGPGGQGAGDQGTQGGPASGGFAGQGPQGAEATRAFGRPEAAGSAGGPATRGAGLAGGGRDAAAWEAGQRVALRCVYGAAPVAAVLFAVLALIADASFGVSARADLALYVTAAVFAVAAIVTFTLGDLPGGAEHVPAPLALLVRDRSAAALAVAGAVLAGGAVFALARVYAGDLGGGDAGYGAILAGLAVGAGIGLFEGPRVLVVFSRPRLLGLSVIGAALLLVVLALVRNLVVVVFVAAFLGVAAGVAGATARSLAASAPGRLRAAALVAALLAAAVLPPLAGALGGRRVRIGGAVYDVPGASIALLVAALVALVLGLVAYRRLDDRRGVPLLPDLSAALRGEKYTLPLEAPETPARPAERGVFVAFEGGEGAGKTTQARLAAIWLRDHGYDVVTTHEPGATKIGMRLRAMLLDRETTGLSSRAETLLYAADRADHVANVVRPAMERGAIVVTDRYVDSSLAYQGFGRRQPVAEIASVNAWATGDLVPDLTVLLEVPPETGLNRLSAPADRLESEPAEFHERVREGFRALADAEPDRYLVLDARRPQAELSREIHDRIRAILPDPVPAGTEDATSTFPAIRD